MEYYSAIKNGILSKCSNKDLLNNMLNEIRRVGLREVNSKTWLQNNMAGGGGWWERHICQWLQNHNQKAGTGPNIHLSR